MRRRALRIAIAIALFALAAAAGFFLSSGKGRERMRQEAERRLSELLAQPVEIASVQIGLRRGLELSGSNLRVGEIAVGADGARAPLTLRTVRAGLETRSLLLGRFRLKSLEIDGLDLVLRHDLEDQWSPDFVDRHRDEPEGDLEKFLGLPNSLIAAAAFLVEGQEIADHIEITDASIEFEDERRAGTVRLRLEQASARLDRSWLRNRSDLAIEGTVVDPDGLRTSLEAHGRLNEDGDGQITITTRDFAAANLRPYLSRSAELADLAGKLSGVVVVTSRERGHGRIELDWTVRTLEAGIPMGASRMHLASPETHIGAAIEVDPERVDLSEVAFRGPSLELTLSGSAERPLRAASPVILRSELRGLGLADLERLAGGLPPESARSMLSLFERVESGTIPSVSARGYSTLHEIGQLLSGELAAIPPELDLRAELHGVTVGTSESDRLQDLDARARWSGDLFELLGATARFNEEPIPRIDLAVHGVSHLLGAVPEGQRLTHPARPLPGLGALWDLVRGPDLAPGQSRAPTPPIQVELRELQHPALRWPVRNASITIDGSQRDLHVTISDGRWAGEPIRGEAVLSREPDPELRIELRIEPSLDEHEHTHAPAAAAAPEPESALPFANEWAAGRFSSLGLHGGPLGFDTVAGSFAIRGQTLLLTDVAATLAGGGTLNSDISFSLATEGEVLTGLDLTIDDAEANRVAQVFGLPPDFISGRADLRGQLAGPVLPGRLLIDSLVGSLEVTAREGQVRKSVPLLAAVAHATEGLSPMSASEALQFEKLGGTFDFEHGRVSTDRLALDGPLRLFAAGTIDFTVDPAPIDATLGIFLLRQADLLLGEIPVVKLLLPGSDRGLIGAYFEITGPVAKPRVRPMPMKSLTDGVPLPAVLRGPFETLRGLLGNGRNLNARTN